LYDFQYENLEPFNKVFPDISLDQSPVTVFHLDLSKQDVRGVDFSKFRNLEVLDLNESIGLTATQFNAIPATSKALMKILGLIGVDVTDFDFSEFISLKSLAFQDTRKSLTADQFNSIGLKTYISNLELTCANAAGFDFSGFTGLKSLILLSVLDLTANQFNAIPQKAKAFIERLELIDVNVSDFIFSEFCNLKSLSFHLSKGLTAAQFNAIPEEVKASIETLDLSYVNIRGFDFSGYTGLKALSLSRSTGLNSALLNAIPSTIEHLDLSWLNIRGFDFSVFTNLKTLKYASFTLNL
jgi:hypothetical protein